VNFIYDPSLVLYLPLYELDGNSIVSRDACGHLSSVNGALWRPYGRHFDGTDDYIEIAHNSAYDQITEFTAMAWVTYQAHGVVMGRDNGAGTRVWKLRGASREVFGAGNGGYDGFSVPTDGSWYFLTMTYKPEVAVKIFVDDRLALEEAITGTLGTAADEAMRIGSRLDGGEYHGGNIGEVWFYNRALTPPEIQQNYLATKWRYR